MALPSNPPEWSYLDAKGNLSSSFDDKFVSSPNQVYDENSVQRNCQVDSAMRAFTHHTLWVEETEQPALRKTPELHTFLRASFPSSLRCHHQGRGLWDM